MQPSDPTQPPAPGAGGPPSAPAWPLTLGDALEIGGGALIFLFSFAPFISSSTPSLFGGPEGRYDDWWNAWSLQIFMVPLTLFVVAAGVLLILMGLSRRFWSPDREVLGFRPNQIAVGIALFAFLVLLGYALSRKTAYISFSWGGAFMLIGALAATVGAFLNHFRVGGLLPLPNLRPRPAAPPAGQYPGAQYPAGQYPTEQYPGGYAQPAAPPAAPPAPGQQQPPAPPAPQ
ncbi:hypothetical protein [Luedemannella helvata]|uniref:Uncharacterized protein n=1 Tax=Luedemannella helvata TaxID=349315 RepID=A0ABN2JYB4_9ACTN